MGDAATPLWVCDFADWRGERARVGSLVHTDLSFGSINCIDPCQS
jgi:hypothetical protein